MGALRRRAPGKAAGLAPLDLLARVGRPLLAFLAVVLLFPAAAPAQLPGAKFAANLKLVPNVVNLTRTEADARIAAAGLTPAPPLANGKDATQLVVVSQAPEAGKSEVGGGRVTMTTQAVAPPPPVKPLVAVPNLVGLTASQAMSTLAEVGLKVGKVSAAKGAAGALTVASSLPAAGAKVLEGASVSYVLASNLRPVPDVLGMDDPSAVQTLRRAGFEPRPHRAGPNGLAVQSQEPAPGASAPAGAVITLEIGAPAPPDVIGLIWKGGLAAVAAGAAAWALRKWPIKPTPTPGVVVHLTPPEAVLLACAPSKESVVGLRWSLDLESPRSSLAGAENRHD